MCFFFWYNATGDIMTENERNKLSLDNMVVKSNKLVNGKYNLKTIDHKMMLTLCSLISSKDDDFIEVTLTVDEMADLFNIKSNDKYELYRVLSKECKRLLGATIEYDESTEKGKRKWTGMTIFSTMHYNEGKGTVQMKFNDDMKDFLLDIKETYTKFKLGYVINFKNQYSFRLYELLKSYEKTGERTLLVDELRTYMNLEENQFERYTQFKNRVILKCIEEINKYSDIKVELKKEEKEKQKVVGLIFEIRRNDYRYPVDNLLDYERYNKKTKAELQTMLNSMILARYKIPLRENTTDLFCKEAIITLIIELKNNNYEDVSIKHPIPYFTGVLKKKHQEMTGEEITSTMIRRHEIESITMF